MLFTSTEIIVISIFSLWCVECERIHFARNEFSFTFEFGEIFCLKVWCYFYVTIIFYRFPCHFCGAPLLLLLLLWRQFIFIFFVVYKLCVENVVHSSWQRSHAWNPAADIFHRHCRFHCYESGAAFVRLKCTPRLRSESHTMKCVSWWRCCHGF